MILCHWSNRLECTALALEVPFISILRLSENIASPGPFLGFKRQVWAKRLHRDKSVQSVTMQLAVLPSGKQDNFHARAWKKQARIRRACFTVVSTVGQILAAKQCDSMKCSANRIRSLYLRKTSCASSERLRKFVRLELQISRSEPTELCRRFPRRKLFSAVDQEFVMTHFGRRWRRCLHARIHEGRCFSGAGTQAITQPRNSCRGAISCYSLGAENLITCPGFCSELSVAVLPH